MSIVEILDSENISSNLESWIEECQKFKIWYCKLGTQKIDELALEKAYQKIQPLTKIKIKNHDNRN